ncbi:MAG TPA: PfkB family carbohydrate kinase [Gaiellaceae bacterium]|nr:PfkB family carbohydrate kinase [Gaiellaceae bacterium]
MPPLALVGNLSFDLVDGGLPRIGGAPIHCGRALRMLDARATVIARCGRDDREKFRRGFARLGLPVMLRDVDGDTTTFAFTYEGDRRLMRVTKIGKVWGVADVAKVPRGAWVHVGALLRGDFPVETLAALARGRRVSFDGQGLTRVRAVGSLRLEAETDGEMLRHVAILKLAVEEAQALAGGIEPKALAELGPPEVVVTFGSDGSLVVADGRVTEVRAHHVDVDPTGSGDAFAAAYLVSRAHGHIPAAAARRATGVVGEMLRRRLR